MQSRPLAKTNYRQAVRIRNGILHHLGKFTAYKKGLELGGIVNSIATPQSAEIRPCPLNGRIKKRKPKICKILIASSEPLQGKLAPRRTWPAMVPGGVIIWSLTVSSNLCVAVPDGATELER